MKLRIFAVIPFLCVALEAQSSGEYIDFQQLYILDAGEFVGNSSQRYNFNNNFPVDQVIYPTIGDTPSVQMIDQDKITIEKLLTVVGLATRYDVSIHPDVDTNIEVEINAQTNPLSSVEAYLERISEVSIGLYPESRMIVVMPSPGKLWSD